MAAVDGDVLRSRLEIYEQTMRETGFDETTIQKTLDHTWVTKDAFVACTYSEAREVAEAGFRRERKHFREARKFYNPGGFPDPEPGEPVPTSEDFDKSYIVGTPEQVADQVAELRDIGSRNLMLKMNTGEMETADARASMKLFAEKVMPLFR